MELIITGHINIKKINLKDGYIYYILRNKLFNFLISKTLKFINKIIHSKNSY